MNKDVSALTFPTLMYIAVKGFETNGRWPSKPVVVNGRFSTARWYLSLDVVPAPRHLVPVPPDLMAQLVVLRLQRRAPLQQLLQNTFGRHFGNLSNDKQLIWLRHHQTGWPITPSNFIFLSLKPCLHVTPMFTFVSNVRNGFCGNKWLCSHLTSRL